ncbi:methyltransferase domain-containing protein [Sneathiella chungangensis]|uniref:Methyltransferase domain-containing protein n=1 Tax=Sneathiella chungangensis TaxID=1418234 RepID=A0A845MJ57_9PROT|nr:class I SAM-dependent methyltransferase [Sneathiella chungangensis]MZR23771.1 methyltransferase domain-containing protein [Sneathiella chungangensis]
MAIALEMDTTPNFDAIKAKQNATWASGNYSLIGATLQITGESLAEAMDLRGGQKVLDVAAGNGNFTLAAARRWTDVTSTDYVQSLLKQSQARAEADGVNVEYKIADAEDLPFADDSFDAVASTFGVMFTPNQRKAANEMDRVCRSGGKIGLANWTPEGFIGALFKIIGRYVPPPAGVNSPALWGTEDRIEDFFGATAQKIDITRRHYAFRYRSAQHWLEVFRNYYGPVLKAFGALGSSQQAELSEDILYLLESFNTSGDETLVVPSEYLEIVITRK